MSDDEKVPCETCDCQNRAEVYVSCEGEGAYPYCRDCAEILLRGGETELGTVDDPVVRERDEARVQRDEATAWADALAGALEDIADGYGRHNPGWWIKGAKAAIWSYHKAKKRWAEGES